ncbi:MAG: acylphosphatase [Coriobacteriia bacterium]
MPTIRKRVIVQGRVQGVWFRQSTLAQAQALGLAGTVRNLSDGSVEAVFEGPDWAVDDAVDWCREGPPHAAVQDLIITNEQPQGLSGFSIVN